VRVLVVGAGGMLGTAVQTAVPSTIQLAALRHADLAIEDAQAVERVVTRERPDWIVNCAAYTQVDRAEAEPEAAHRVNAVGAANLARAARAKGVRLLHISTDYVFDGRATGPYREDDPVGPLNVYGRSKLAGEQAIRDILPQEHLIVRTQWLFGEGGPNFVATILRLARERSELKVVNDQHGRPTYARDLAGALWKLIACDARDTVHCANEGVATWFEVALATVAAAGLDTAVEPCTTGEMPRPAPRPAFSVLDCTRYHSIVGSPLRAWQPALVETINVLTAR
jgi:dTDP-4-dehydrorhamnose reductase